MARTLITGGAGFIGSYLARGLLERGDEVVVLDNLSSGNLENLEGLPVEFIEGDIRDPEALHSVMREVNYVLHHAAFVSVPASVEDPHTCFDVNVSGSVNVLWASHQAGIEKVVLASSAAVYGEVEQMVRETASPHPMSPYAASKLSMEQAAAMFSAAYGLSTICLRYFNVYGPRQDPGSQYAAAIPKFIHAMLDEKAPTIYGDGEQSRDFVYIEDVFRANIIALEVPIGDGSPYNIAGGEQVTINELVGILQRILPEAPPASYGPPREGDIYSSAADIQAAVAALGYRPKTTLQEGLTATVQWFQSEGFQPTS